MADKKIVLFCAGGMSTSLLVNKMKEAAKVLGKDYDIAAYGLSSSDKEAPDADVVLLGPQVRYAVNQLRKQYPGKAIEGIDMKAYGTMNGKAVIEQAMKLMGDE